MPCKCLVCQRFSDPGGATGATLANGRPCGSDPPKTALACAAGPFEEAAPRIIPCRKAGRSPGAGEMSAVGVRTDMCRSPVPCRRGEPAGRKLREPLGPPPRSGRKSGRGSSTVRGPSGTPARVRCRALDPARLGRPETCRSPSAGRRGRVGVTAATCSDHCDSADQRWRCNFGLIRKVTLGIFYAHAIELAPARPGYGSVREHSALRYGHGIQVRDRRNVLPESLSWTSVRAARATGGHGSRGSSGREGQRDSLFLHLPG